MKAIFDKSDHVFVKAAIDPSERNIQIQKLVSARNWTSAIYFAIHCVLLLIFCFEPLTAINSRSFIPSQLGVVLLSAIAIGMQSFKLDSQVKILQIAEALEAKQKAEPENAPVTVEP